MADITTGMITASSIADAEASELKLGHTTWRLGANISGLLALTVSVALHETEVG